MKDVQMALKLKVMVKNMKKYQMTNVIYFTITKCLSLYTFI